MSSSHHLNANKSLRDTNLSVIKRTSLLKLDLNDYRARSKSKFIVNNFSCNFSLKTLILIILTNKLFNAHNELYCKKSSSRISYRSFVGSIAQLKGCFSSMTAPVFFSLN